MILNLVSASLIALGLLFFLGAVVGLVRFPDFFTRMHAAGKGDTLSTLLILLGLVLANLSHLSVDNGLVALKIVGIGIFIALTSPTSTHALMRAGFEAGIRPWKRKEGKGSGSG